MSLLQNNIFLECFDKNFIKKCEDLFVIDDLNNKENIEIEFKLKNIINYLNNDDNKINFVMYILLLEYLKNLNYLKKYEIINYDELDMNSENFRVTFKNKNLINGILNKKISINDSLN